MAAPPPSPDRTLARARNEEYPHQVWWFLAIIIFTISACQLVSRLHGKLAVSRRLGAKRSMPGSEEGAGPSRASVASWVKLPLAAINAFRVVAFRSTINLGSSYTLNLAEVALTCLYIGALFTWTFINTTTVAGLKLSPGYWANRAGTIATSQIPLVTVLGTKNNCISWLTGVSHDKLNYLHRSAARTIMVLLWIHAGGRIQMKLAEHWLHETWFWVGVAGLAGLSLVVILSIKPIRSNAYELFFYAHFSLVMLFLIGGYFHTKQWEYQNWVWPAFLFWGLDRLIRFGRLFFFNTHLPSLMHTTYKTATDRHNYTLEATPELLSPSFVRLRVHRPRHMHWSPGQTAYLILPSVSRIPVEAHPFTIASVNDRARSDDSEKSAAGKSADYWKELVFLINVREGFTKRLAEAARKGRTVPVLVDGAYGESPDLRGDDTIVLVAGGTGVSYTLALLLDVINKACESENVCRRLVFIWAIRDASHFQWISDAVASALSRAPAHLVVEIRLFVTSGAVLPEVEYDEDVKEDVESPKGSKPSTPKELESPSSHPAVRFETGRPDLSGILREEVSNATGKLSVTVCGSTAIARATRSALVMGPSTVMKGGPSVSLHVESYGYA